VIESESEHGGEISPLRNMQSVGHIGGSSALSIMRNGSIQASYRGKKIAKTSHSRTHSDANYRSRSLAKNMSQIASSTKEIKQLREVDS
jgi:hypothetical protein